MKLPVQVAPVLRNSLFWPARGPAQAGGVMPAAAGPEKACSCIGCGNTMCPMTSTGCGCNASNQCVCAYG